QYGKLVSKMLACCLLLSQLSLIGEHSKIGSSDKNYSKAFLNPQMLTQEQIESREKVIASVTAQLLDYNVPFDPSILFANNWKEKLTEAFALMPEAQVDRFYTGPMKGLVVANELILSNRINLTGNTIILAKSIKYNGDDITIKGPYGFHLFVTGSTSSDSPNTMITIDTSGFGRKEWMALQSGLIDHPDFVAADEIDKSGQKGQDGAFGIMGGGGTDGQPGSDGANGSCGGGNPSG